MTGLILNEHEVTRLAHCERVIERGLSTFVTVGAALWEIREAKLYRASHGTIETYVRERWGISRQHAGRLMTAAATARALRDAPEMEPRGYILEPETEKQVRPLTSLEPEQAAEAWGRAVDAAGGQPTAQQVAQAAAEVKAEASDATNTDRARQAFTSNESCEWWTPAQYVEAARAVMGAIDLDPASCAKANETVGATRFFTREQDGLSQTWRGKIWLNCPRSKHDPGGRSHAAWIAHLFAQYGAEFLDQAVTIVNVATGDPWFQPLWEHPMCFADHRIKHIDGDSSGSGKDRPTHSSVFVGIGVDENRFAKHFAKFGKIVLPMEDGTLEVVG